MTTQPEALRLAYWLERDGANCQQHIDAAAELRRLHEAHDWQYRMAGERLRRVEKLEAQRDALLEALRIAEAALSDIGDADREPGDDIAWCEARAAEAIPQARAAIAKVKEGK